MYQVEIIPANDAIERKSASARTPLRNETLPALEGPRILVFMTRDIAGASLFTADGKMIDPPDPCWKRSFISAPSFRHRRGNSRRLCTSRDPMRGARRPQRFPQLRR